MLRSLACCACVASQAVGGSILDRGFHLFGLGHHLLDLLHRGNAVAEVLLVVDGNHLGIEVGGHAVAELLDGVHTGLF